MRSKKKPPPLPGVAVHRASALELALRTDIGMEQSSRAIAEHVGVSHVFVEKVRDEIEAEHSARLETVTSTSEPGEYGPADLGLWDAYDPKCACALSSSYREPKREHFLAGPPILDENGVRTGHVERIPLRLVLVES